MTSPVDIRPDHLETVQDILRKHLPAGVKVWVFGSRANWTTKDSSDLDLALEGDGTLSHKLLGALKDAFEDSALPYTVDVVDLHRISDSFRQIVESQRTPLLLDGTEHMATGQWREVKLGDVATIVMGQSPPGSTVSNEPGVALLNGPTEFGQHHPVPVQFTTDPRKFAQPGDVLFCVRGSTTGRMNWADQEYAVGRGVAAIRHTEDPTLQPLLRGAIEVALPELLIAATGSTFPNVSASQIADMPYPDLNVEEQKAIAHVLGTLDDKIELNRRMNETLEAMARALFKSWFVDFEPVRAKMEGRDTGLPSYLAALFPDRLVDSELGEIPEGWEVGQFSDVATQLRGNENPAISPDTVFSHFSIPAYDEGQTPKRELGGSIKSTKSRVLQDTVLLSKLNPEIKRVWLVDVVPNERAICSTEFLVLKAKPPFQSSYVYCLALSPFFRQQIESIVTGTSKSHQRAPADAVLSLEAFIPRTRVIETFVTSVSGLFRRSMTLRRESHALSAQRDELLPRLVSGQVRL